MSALNPTEGVRSNGKLRHAAVAEWQGAAAAGVEMTGKQLAERFGRSPSWGRGVAREARGEGSTIAEPDAPTDDTAAATTWQRATTVVAVVVVAAVAAVISYSHLQDLASAAGEGPWQAALLPLSVDGMMLAASMTALARKQAGQQIGALPWLALVLGVLASTAANIASAEPTLEGRLVAAWPPIALLISLELLLRQMRSTAGGP